MQVLQPIQYQPRPEVLLFADELPGAWGPTPHGGATVVVGPDGDNSRRGIPTPNPFVLALRHWQIPLWHNQRLLSTVAVQVESLPTPRFDEATLIEVVERAITGGEPITLGVAR